MHSRPAIIPELGPGALVDSVYGGIAAADFRQRYQRPARPVVLRGAASAWPATSRWTIDDFRQRLGEHRVPLARVEDGMMTYAEGAGMDYQEQRLADFLDGVAAEVPEWFLMLRPRLFFPELLDDLGEHPPMRGADWSDIRVTIATTGTMTPIHREFFDNLFTLFEGRKEALLFPASDGRNLYAHGPFSGVPHMSPVDPRGVDLRRHRRAARTTPFRCTLAPGDALFIPRGWWHVVLTTAPAIGAGMWWAEGARSLLPLVASAYKRLMGVKT